MEITMPVPEYNGNPFLPARMVENSAEIEYFQKLIELVKSNKSIEDLSENDQALIAQQYTFFRQLINVSVKTLSNERYKYYPKELQDLLKNQAFMLAAIQQHEWAILSASDEMQEDQKFLLDAITMNPRVLFLIKNMDFIKGQLLKNPLLLQHAPEEVKNDRKFILSLVAKNGLSLQFASHHMQEDRDIILVATAQNGEALQYSWSCFKRVSEIERRFLYRFRDDPFLKELSQLKMDSSPLFLALEPLKDKLKQETNSERKEVAKTMIIDIEKAILERCKNTDFDFEQAFHNAVNKAKPKLEQQTGWKKVIDYVANTIMSLVYPDKTEQNQAKPMYKSFFFTNPNPVQKEINEVQEAIFKKAEF